MRAGFLLCRMARSFTIKSIGVVRSTRRKIADDNWNREKVRIELDPKISLDTLTGIDVFSHLEILFVFDKVKPTEICWGKRHVRGKPELPEFGIFAHRARVRPNRIGVTIVKLESRRGRKLFVEGLDAIDGTPVIDIKPVLKVFLPRGKVREPHWVTKLMKTYW